MCVVDRLEKLYTGAVYDALRAMCGSAPALPPDIRPLNDNDRPLVGRIFTISGIADPDVGEQESLRVWTRFLSVAPPDSVVICQPNDSTLAHMGELSAETLAFRGVRGYIVAGGCRDVAFIRRLGFRVWARYCTPVDIVGRWRVTGLGEPISIGAAVVNTGDYVIADDDGVLVVPEAIAGDVVIAAEQVLRDENLVRKAILEGMDPDAAYLKYGVF